MSGQAFYVDRNHQIQLDDTHTPLDSAINGLKRLAGFRTYDPIAVLKAASHEAGIKRKHLPEICVQAGSILKVEKQIAELFAKAVAAPTNDNQVQIAEMAKTLDSSQHIAQFESMMKAVYQDSDNAKSVALAVCERARVALKLKQVGLDPAKYADVFDEVKFLIDTRLIYSILGYQNSTENGSKEHQILKSNLGGTSHLKIKMGGHYVPVQEIREKLVWDEEETALASKDNPNQRWNYFHEGLVPLDRFYHHEKAGEANYPLENKELHPVARLSKNEMAELLAHASTFSATAPHTGKKCVVQFFTNPRSISDNPLLRNLNSQVPVHCGIRLVLEDGSVYSTGFGSALHEDQWMDGMGHFAASINGQPTNMDYEEFRPHEGRVVTSIPIGEKEAKTILEQLNKYREESIRFNIAKQNCMRLGTHVLDMAGYNLDIRVPVETFFSRMLPDLADIPVVGWAAKPLESVSSITPEIVSTALGYLRDAALVVPKSGVTMLFVVLSYVLGANTGSPLPKKENSNLKGLDFFDQLIHYPWDAVGAEVYHSSLFINWQLQQSSTAVHAYKSKPNMNITPPKGDEDKKWSDEKKRNLAAIYKFNASQLPVSEHSASFPTSV